MTHLEKKLHKHVCWRVRGAVIEQGIYTNTGFFRTAQFPDQDMQCAEVSIRTQQVPLQTPLKDIKQASAPIMQHYTTNALRYIPSSAVTSSPRLIRRLYLLAGESRPTTGLCPCAYLESLASSSSGLSARPPFSAIPSSNSSAQCCCGSGSGGDSPWRA